MSTAPRYLPHYTVADHASWEGNWELLDGVAVAMTPSPFGKHAEQLSRLAARLWNAIDAAECSATVLAEIDWVVSEDTVVRPDLVVVCGAAPERHVEEPPVLIVEILSAATRDRDLTIKRELYEAKHVAWYGIVDPDEGQSTLLQLDAKGLYQPVPFADVQEIQICPDCVVKLDFGG